MPIYSSAEIRPFTLGPLVTNILVTRKAESNEKRSDFWSLQKISASACDGHSKDTFIKLLPSGGLQLSAADRP